MYEYRGLQDIIFISLYCGVAFLAVVACLYLLLRRGNAFVGDDFKTSRRLRRWTAALLAVYVIYTSNAGELMREYLSQVISIVIIAFLLWRVETLQELPSQEDMKAF